MSRKPKLDEQPIRNELSESAFFRRKAPVSGGSARTDEPSPQPETVRAETDRPLGQERSPVMEVAPPGRPYARTLTRIPFEIYRDQHSTLKKLSLEQQARGEKGSMSQMVREALDMYISGRLGWEE